MQAQKPSLPSDPWNTEPQAPLEHELVFEGMGLLTALVSALQSLFALFILFYGMAPLLLDAETVQVLFESAMRGDVMPFISLPWSHPFITAAGLGLYLFMLYGIYRSGQTVRYRIEPGAFVADRLSPFGNPKRLQTFPLDDIDAFYTSTASGKRGKERASLWLRRMSGETAYIHGGEEVSKLKTAANAFQAQLMSMREAGDVVQVERKSSPRKGGGAFHTQKVQITPHATGTHIEVVSVKEPVRIALVTAMGVTILGSVLVSGTLVMLTLLCWFIITMKLSTLIYFTFVSYAFEVSDDQVVTKRRVLWFYHRVLCADVKQAVKIKVEEAVYMHSDCRMEPFLIAPRLSAQEVESLRDHLTESASPGTPITRKLAQKNGEGARSTSPW